MRTRAEQGDQRHQHSNRRCFHHRGRERPFNRRGKTTASLLRLPELLIVPDQLLLLPQQFRPRTAIVVYDLARGLLGFDPS